MRQRPVIWKPRYATRRMRERAWAQADLRREAQAANRLARVRATATTRIDCSPDRVFDVLADMRRETEWNSRVSSADLLSGEPIGPGSRFAIVNGGTSYDVTVTTFTRPSKLTFEAKGRPDLTITYALTRVGDGTELQSELDFRPTGALKVLFALLAPVIRRDVPKQYASLKALCER